MEAASLEEGLNELLGRMEAAGIAKRHLSLVELTADQVETVGSVADMHREHAPAQPFAGTIPAVLMAPISP